MQRLLNNDNIISQGYVNLLGGSSVSFAWITHLTDYIQAQQT